MVSKFELNMDDEKSKKFSTLWSGISVEISLLHIAEIVLHFLSLNPDTSDTRTPRKLVGFIAFKFKSRLPISKRINENNLNY